MKRILLSLALMLPCLGAWAEVVLPKVSTDAQKYYYAIKSLRTGKYAYFNGDNGQLLQEANPNHLTTDENSVKYLWYVTADGENYKLHNVATENIYAAYNSFTETGATVYIKENPYRSGYVCVSTTADLSANCWDDQGNQTKIGDYNPKQNDNEGTSWSFIEVGEKTTCNFTLTDEAENVFSGSYSGYKNLTLPAINGASLANVAWNNANLSANVTFSFPVSKEGGATNWTYIKTRPISNYAAYFYVNNNSVKFKTENPNNTGLSYLPSSDVNEIAKYMWSIYPKYNFAEGKFTFNIKNSASKKYLPVVSSAISSITVSETAGEYCWGEANSGYYGFHVPSNSNLFISAGSSGHGEKNAEIYNKTGNTNHQGVNLLFVAPLYKANCVLTDNSGSEYSWLTTINYTLDENDVERPAAIGGIFDSWITNVSWNEGVCYARVTFPFPVSNATTSNPTQIANWGAANDADMKRWHAVLEEGVYNVKAQTAIPNINEWGAWLWEIYPQFDNGTFTYQIKNAHTGTYVYADPSKENAQGAKGYVTLSETPTTFTIVKNGNYINWGYSVSATKTLKLTTNGAADTDVYLGSYTGTHAGNHIAFPALTKFNLTVGSTGYATLYTPVSGTFAGEMKTYAIKNASSDYASLEELTGIAANQGAIIEATPGTYTFTAGEVSSDWSGNLLTGTSVNTMVEGEAYVLGNVDGIGLYKAQLTDGSFLNNAGKAYLPASAVSTSAKVLRFNLGGTTAIESVLNNSTDANAPIYDLSGRRVMNAVKGGIYIKNGKKFIVK